VVAAAAAAVVVAGVLDGGGGGGELLGLSVLRAADTVVDLVAVPVSTSGSSSSSSRRSGPWPPKLLARCAGLQTRPSARRRAPGCVRTTRRRRSTSFFQTIETR